MSRKRMDALHRDSESLSASEREWLHTRRHFLSHRHELGKKASSRYPSITRVHGLLIPRHWLPKKPIPLGVPANWFVPRPQRVPRTSEAEPRGACTQASENTGRNQLPDTLSQLDMTFVEKAEPPFITADRPEFSRVLPIRPGGQQYRRYSEVIAELTRPVIFDNRPTYRLVNGDLSEKHRLVFTQGTYFDGIDIGDACAHEYTAYISGNATEEKLRNAIGDPCNPTQRPMNIAIATLLIRRDTTAEDHRFFLHWRDPNKVAHAGNLYQVIPVGIFQPLGNTPGHWRNDFDIWRCINRELSEEFLGAPEEYGNDPLDYSTWPFLTEVEEERKAGRIRSYCLGMGVDPLTLATDLLTAMVIDSPAFDNLFNDISNVNEEGEIIANSAGEITGIPFSQKSIEEFTLRKPMQASGAALLELAWQHRSTIID